MLIESKGLFPLWELFSAPVTSLIMGLGIRGQLRPFLAPPATTLMT